MQKLVCVVFAITLAACSSMDSSEVTFPDENPNDGAASTSQSDSSGDGEPAGTNPSGDSPVGDSPTAPDQPVTSDDDPGTTADQPDDPPVDPGPGLAPTIPQPNGACPTFETGSQTIMGLDTDMLVGDVQATKGPLLIIWHGTASNGSVSLNFQLPGSVRDDITGQGGIIIAPNSNGQARGGFSPNGVWYEEGDLDYADHLVACAVQEHNIDPRRIYVTGCSAGGLMTSAMAIKRSSYVAAASPNSGGLTPLVPSLQSSDWVPATLSMHGGGTDTIGAFNFGQSSAKFNDFVVNAGGFAVDCNHNAGHCTAPGELREASWAFMKAHTYGADPSPYASGLPAEFPDYCEIW